MEKHSNSAGVDNISKESNISNSISIGKERNECSFCGKNFKKQVTLVIHERKHIWQQPYRCLACGKRFATVSRLSKHQTSHSPENLSEQQSKLNLVEDNISSVEPNPKSQISYVNHILPSQPQNQVLAQEVQDYQSSVNVTVLSEGSETQGHTNSTENEDTISEKQNRLNPDIDLVSKAQNQPNVGEDHVVLPVLELLIPDDGDLYETQGHLNSDDNSAFLTTSDQNHFDPDNSRRQDVVKFDDDHAASKMSELALVNERLNESQDRHNYADNCDVDREEANEKNISKIKSSKTTKHLNSCSVCQKIFKRRNYLKLHMRKHSESFSCDLCKKKFYVLKNFKDHYEICMSETITNDTTSINSKSLLKSNRICQRFDIDDNIFPAKDMSQNMDVSAIGKQAQCRHGKKVSKYSKTRIQKSNSVSKVKSVENHFSCDVCKKEFKQKHHLELHLRHHSKENFLKCDRCKKTFYISQNFTKHLESCGPKLMENKTYLVQYGVTTDSVDNTPATNDGYSDQELQQCNLQVLHKSSNLCYKCGKVYVRLGNFKKHINMCESEPSGSSSCVNKDNGTIAVESIRQIQNSSVNESEKVLEDKSSKKDKNSSHFGQNSDKKIQVLHNKSSGKKAVREDSQTECNKSHGCQKCGKWFLHHGNFKNHKISCDKGEVSDIGHQKKDSTVKYIQKNVDAESRETDKTCVSTREKTGKVENVIANKHSKKTGSEMASHQEITREISKDQKTVHKCYKCEKMFVRLGNYKTHMIICERLPLSGPRQNSEKRVARKSLHSGSSVNGVNKVLEIALNKNDERSVCINEQSVTCNSKIHHKKEKPHSSKEIKVKRKPVQKCQNCGKLFLHYANLNEHLTKCKQVNTTSSNKTGSDSVLPNKRNDRSRSGYTLSVKVNKKDERFVCFSQISTKDFKGQGQTKVYCTKKPASPKTKKHGSKHSVPISSKKKEKGYSIEGQQIKKHKCNKCGKRFVYLDNCKQHTILCKKENLASEQKTYSQKDLSDSKTKQVPKKNLDFNETANTGLLIVQYDSKLYEKKHGKKLNVLKKSLKCKVCSKDFKYLHTFNIHKWKHSGHRPYQCNSCGKQFLQACNLANHTRSGKCCQVKSQRNYSKSPNTDKVFLKSDNCVGMQNSDSLFEKGSVGESKELDQSEIILTESVCGSDKCTSCGKMFSNAFDLARHIKAHKIKQSIVRKKDNSRKLKKGRALTIQYNRKLFRIAKLEETTACCANDGTTESGASGTSEDGASGTTEDGASGTTEENAAVYVSQKPANFGSSAQVSKSHEKQIESDDVYRNKSRLHACTKCDKTFAYQRNLTRHRKSHDMHEHENISDRQLVTDKTDHVKQNVEEIAGGTDIVVGDNLGKTSCDNVNLSRDAAGLVKPMPRTRYRVIQAKSSDMKIKLMQIKRQEYTCTTCERTFSKACNLARHRKSHVLHEIKHKNTLHKKTLTNKHDCKKQNTENICNVGLNDEISADEVNLSIDGAAGLERPVMQTGCQIKQIEHQPMAYACSICERTFSQACNLARHRMSHSVPRFNQSKLHSKSLSNKRDTGKQKVENMTACHTVHGSDKRNSSDLNLAQNAHLETDHKKFLRSRSFGNKDFVNVRNKTKQIVGKHDTVNNTGLYVSNHCTLCNRNFRFSHHLLAHKLANHGTEGHKCSTCGKKFVHLASLRKHKQLHALSKSGRVVGNRSLIRLSNSRDKQTNANNVSLKKIRKRRFLPKKCVEKKQKSVESRELISCRYCTNQFESAASLKKHFHSSHLGQKTYKCVDCGRIFSDFTKYRIHLQIHKKNRTSSLVEKRILANDKKQKMKMLKQEISRSVEGSLYRCDQCSKVFYRVGNMVKHAGIHLRQILLSAKKKKLVSLEEKKVTISITDTNQMKSVHIAESEGSNSVSSSKLEADNINQDSSLTGSNCNSIKDAIRSDEKVTTRNIQENSSNDLVEHNQNDDVISCESIEGQSIIKLSELKLVRDSNNHKAERDTDNATCMNGRETETENILNKSTALKDKTFTINYKGNQFARTMPKVLVEGESKTQDTKLGQLANSSTKKLNLSSMNIGDWKNKCYICDKSFSNPSYLKVHVMLHTGVKPHKCTVCGRAFAHRNSFDRHRNNVHLKHCDERETIPSHKCDTCDQFYSSKAKLSQHMKEHKPVVKFNWDYYKRMFTCHVCGKGFVRQKNLEKHEIEHMNRSDQLSQLPLLEQNRQIDEMLNRSQEVDSSNKPELSFLNYDLGSNSPKFSEIRKKFICPVCEEEFSKRWSLEFHLKEHSNENNSSHVESAGESVCKNVSISNNIEFKDCSVVLSRNDLHKNSFTVGHEYENLDRSFHCFQGNLNHFGGTPKKSSPFHFPASRTYTCSVCCKRFFEIQELRRHVVEHAEVF